MMVNFEMNSVSENLKYLNYFHRQILTLDFYNNLTNMIFFFFSLDPWGKMANLSSFCELSGLYPRLLQGSHSPPTEGEMEKQSTSWK